MHAIFMAYGKIEEVELLLRDMRAQKHFLKFYDENKKEKGGAWIQGQIRLLPFGFMEYVFPKEDIDIVLSTLEFDTIPYGITDNFFIKKFLKKFLKCEPVGEYKKEKKYLWIKQNVSIIPIGIREDKEIYDELVKAHHEAI